MKTALAASRQTRSRQPLSDCRGAGEGLFVQTCPPGGPPIMGGQGCWASSMVRITVICPASIDSPTAAKLAFDSVVRLITTFFSSVASLSLNSLSSYNGTSVENQFTLYLY